MPIWLRIDRFHDQPAPTQPPHDPEQAWKTLTLVNSWVTHAETKAGATLTAVGVAGTGLYALVNGIKEPGILLPWLAGTCAGLLLVAGICCGLALRPRLRSQEDPTNGLYFNHIARAHPTVQTYQETLQLLTSNSDHVIKEIGSQIWANAHVAHKKFCWAGLGLYALMLAGACLGGTALDITLR